MVLALATQPALAGDEKNDRSGAVQTEAALSEPTDPQPIVPNAGTIRSFYGPATGMAGTIRSFHGEVEGEAGTIRSFAGTIRSFAGTIRSFQQDVATGGELSQAFWGDLQPDAGTIRSFSGDFEAYAGTIRSFAGTIRSFQDPSLGYPELMTHLQSLISASEQEYGAAVYERTGKSFDEAITSKLLAKYGIDPTEPASLDLNELGLELFLLDWYDNVNAYSGRDSADRWMQQVNWSPALTQMLGSGFDARVGLLDFTVTGEGTGAIVASGGVSNIAGGHGSAVVSLIAGAHDNFGVMGVAPRASIVSYNPFDETMTAGWADIQAGLGFLMSNKASVINMSLGVPGSTLASGWNEVFSDRNISRDARQRIFVMSAGNDGVVQTQDVEWNFATNPTIILVGSVDPTNTISSFSNQPGKACLVERGSCFSAANTLMNRYIVAPGELILVSDGEGGVTRMSGTSFAAPLVSGAIALIHDRWPWLATKSDVTANLILDTARDLGEPGTDPVYGRGMLDIEAALSPLDWNALNWQVKIGNRSSDVSASFISSGLEELRVTWEAEGAYVVAFETLDKTFRDFMIPLSSKLAGQNVGRKQENFMAYLEGRFWEWAATQTVGTPNGDMSGTASIRFAATLTAPVASFGGWKATISMAPRIEAANVNDPRRSMDTLMAIESPGGQFGMTLGDGGGARAIAGQAGFALTSDSALATGGVNPLSSFASGGAFGQFSLALNQNTRLHVAVTDKDERRQLDRFGLSDRLALGQIGRDQATAGLMTLEYQATRKLQTSLSYTLLNEESALLGMQSLDRNDFRRGSKTDALTVGSQFAVSPTLTLATSATLGRTRQGDLDRQNIAVSADGLFSSAFQIAATKTQLFESSDIMRLTIAQPLHLEGGSIDINTIQVVDRLTGELGNVVQTANVANGPRTFVAEGIYGRSMLDGAANINFFGRARLQGDEQASQLPDVTVGARFAVDF